MHDKILDLDFEQRCKKIDTRRIQYNASTSRKVWYGINLFDITEIHNTLL